MAGKAVRAKGWTPTPKGAAKAMTLSADEYHDHLKTTAVRAGFTFDVVLPSENDLSIGQLRFRYLDWGTKGRRPILFLHGGALTAHTWDLCCLALRDEFYCVALDQRGHGDSDWAPDADYSISAQREDIRGARGRAAFGSLSTAGPNRRLWRRSSSGRSPSTRDGTRRSFAAA